MLPRVPAASARRLLRTFGGRQAGPAIAAYVRRGPAGVAELCAALLAPPRLPARRDGRAVFEDEERCLVLLARAHPQADRKSVV